MGGKKSSILVVDTDQAATLTLAATLKEFGHSVLTARDAIHALSILEFRAFEVLMVDIEASRVEGIDLIGWARSICPRPRIVVIGNSASADEQASIVSRGAGLFLSKPLDLGRLIQFLESTRSHSSFSGMVEGVDIVEYVQFILLGGKKTLLEITSNVGTQGRIFLSEGLVLHAVCGILQGEQALYRCLCFKEGSFAHLPWQEPEQITINKPGEFLLMEAARKRDEVWGEDGGDEDKQTIF